MSSDAHPDNRKILRCRSLESEVRQRMSEGDMPILDSSYSYKSRFSDGSTVAHQVMQILVYDGTLASPGERGLPWSTCTNAHGAAPVPSQRNSLKPA
jgi:hypothetical protein